MWLLTQTRVPSISFSLPNGDPALTMFSAANFPGSSSGQRNEARDLYAVLTGHISQIGGTARLDAATGRYVYNGDSRQEGRLREFDLFFQDNWKVKPNLSVNVGLRYASSSRSTRRTAATRRPRRKTCGASRACIGLQPERGHA